MSTSAVRNNILYPADEIHIMDISYSAATCAKEVDRRFHMYLYSHLNSEQVVEEFTLIQKQTDNFYAKASQLLYCMEREWTASKDENKTVRANSCNNYTKKAVIIPVLSEQLLQYDNTFKRFFASMWPWFYYERKREAIHRKYEECRDTVRETVIDHLKTKAGPILVAVNKIPKRIGALEETTKQQQNSLQAKRRIMESLANKITLMEETIFNLQKGLKQNK